MSDGRTDGDDLSAKVLQWVEKSGRALELRTARAFLQGGASNVDQSFIYTDPVKNVQREGDVVANFDWQLRSSSPRRLQCTLRVVVECKAGNSKPWIAFLPSKDEEQTMKPADWLVRAWAPSKEAENTVATAWEGWAPFEDGPLASHVVAARLDFDANKPRENEANPADDAIRQATSAATALAQLDLAAARRATLEHAPLRATYVLAALVTAAPMYTCRLDSKGNIALEETDHFTVRSHSNNTPSRVHVFDETKLDEFVQLMKNLSLRASN